MTLDTTTPLQESAHERLQPINKPLPREQAEVYAAYAVYISDAENRDVVLSRTDDGWEGNHSFHELTLEIIMAMLHVLRVNIKATDEELKQAEDKTVKSHGYYDGRSGGYAFHQLYAVRSHEVTKELSDVIKGKYVKIQEIADKLMFLSNDFKDDIKQLHIRRSETL